MNDLASSQYEKALVLAQDHQYQESIKLCRLILLGEPKYVDCRLLLARSLLALARYEEVVAEAQILIDLAPDNAQVYAIKGEAHFFKGEFVAAHSALSTASRLDPSDTKVRRLLADIEPSVGTGGGGLDAEEDSSATRSYPLAEQVTDVDPTEMMDSPPVIEPWDEDDEDEPESVASIEQASAPAFTQEGAVSPHDQETVTTAGVAPELLRATMHPSVATETKSIPAEEYRQALARSAADFHDEVASGEVPAEQEDTSESRTKPALRAKTPGRRPESGAPQESAPREQMTVPPQPKAMAAEPESEQRTRPALGPKLQVKSATVEGADPATPVEEGPRGAVFKFLPSDKLVTVEQVAITTGEIKGEEEFALGEVGSRETPTSEGETVSLKVTPPPGRGAPVRKPKATVQVADEALLVKPRRIRPLARHRRGGLPSPDGSASSPDQDEMEDAPTTPHLDISNVPGKAAAERRQPMSGGGRGASLDIDFQPSQPKSPPRPPKPPAPPPLPPTGSQVAPRLPERPQREPAAAKPVPGMAGAGAVAAGRPVAPPAAQAQPRSAGPQRPVPSAAGAGPARQAAGAPRVHPAAPVPQAVPARPAAPVQFGAARKAPASSAAARPRSSVTPRLSVGGRAATGVRSQPRERTAGTGLTSASDTRRSKGALWRRRDVQIGAAVGTVVLLAALAGWMYVRWVHRKQASQKMSRAFVLLGRADPEGLLAAQFLFVRIEKLGVNRREAAAGRALVNLLSSLEYGDSSTMAAQIVGRFSSKAQGPLAMAARAGLALVEGHPDKALEAAGRAVAKHPRSSWGFYFRAAAQDALGDFDGATGGAKRALSLSPSPGLAGTLLLVRIMVDEGLAFERVASVDGAVAAIERVKQNAVNREHPAVLIAEAEARLARCMVHHACPCKDLGAVENSLEKLQIRMQGHSLASVFLPRVRLARAAVLWCMRKTSVAESVLPQVVRQGNPGRPDLDALHASLLIDLHRVSEAVPFLEKAMTRYSGWTRFRLLLARAYLVEHHPDRAYKVLAAVPTKGRSASWYELSVNVLVARGRVKDAVDLAKRGVREYSDRVGVRLAQLRALLAMGKTTKAKKLAEDLFRRHPNDSRVLVASARLLAERGEYLRAKARLDSALSRDPNNAQIRLQLGRVLIGLGKYDEARRHLKQAVANQPALAAGWLALGRLEESQGHMGWAVKKYQMLLRKHPGHREGLFALANVLVRLGRLDDAAKVLAKVPDADHKGMWHLIHGWLLLRKGEFDKAEKELKKAGSSGLSGRSLALALVRRAEALLLLDRPDRAEAVLDSLDGRQRTLPEVRALWGRLWLWRGKPKKAAQRFKRALASCSRWACPLWMKARLQAYVGRAYYLRGSMGPAWARFRRAFQISADDALVYFLKGACLYEDGREDRARRLFEKSIELDHALMENYYYLGELARSAGERSKAATLFRRFLRARRFGALADQARSSLRAVTR